MLGVLLKKIFSNESSCCGGGCGDVPAPQAQQSKEKVNSCSTNQQTPQQQTKYTNPAAMDFIDNRLQVRDCKKFIAVASGKGGVGKSTISVLLAHAAVANGQNVGLIDGDIMGPSLAKMLGINHIDNNGHKVDIKPELDANKRMIPRVSHNIRLNTMGFMLDEDSPAVWRGPMITKALSQLISGTNWGYNGSDNKKDNITLDKLIIDLPPATGDIQLTLCKQYKLDGAVIVTTPQDIAFLDVKKAITMFKKMQVPILGLVINMAYFEDGAGKKIEVFGSSATIKKYCQENNITILAELPIRSDIAACLDVGAEIINNPMQNIVI